MRGWRLWDNSYNFEISTFISLLHLVIPPNQPCTGKGQCVSNAECSTNLHGICTCEPGYFVDELRCTAKKPPLEMCTDDKEVSTGKSPFITFISLESQNEFNFHFFLFSLIFITKICSVLYFFFLSLLFIAKIFSIISYL